MEYSDKVSITLTAWEWHLIAHVLENEAFFKMHSYDNLKVQGAFNMLDVVKKIKEHIEEN